MLKNISLAILNKKINIYVIMKPAGIYIHIPFCKKKCPYCDFYSICDFSLIKQFEKALEKEIQLQNQFTSFSFDTIYFGGGTPLMSGIDSIENIINCIYDKFKILKDNEITIEVNPQSANLNILKKLRKIGVNRINIGVQSFFNKNLNFLKRIHNANDAIKCIEDAKTAGFDNIGIDLIYGLPNQSKKLWQKDLKKACEIKPDHISCYMLTYEKNTPLYESFKKGDIIKAEDKLVVELFKETVRFLENNGYNQYEISNFSKSELKESRHNKKYWTFIPYLGFGPSAHSYLEKKRFWNHKNLKKYIKDLNNEKLPIEQIETLTKAQRMTEEILLGLRQTKGINIGNFNKKYQLDFYDFFEDIVSFLKDKNFIYCDEKICKLKLNGMIYLDSIVSRFSDYI